MNINRTAFLLPVASGVLWGLAGWFVRTLTSWGMDSITILEIRLVPGTLILAAVIFLWDRSLFRIRKRDLWIFAAASLIGALGLNICYNISINSLTLSLAAVLLGLSPVFVVLMAAPLFGERITLKKGLCTAAAFAGCILVSGVLEAGTVTCTVPGFLIGVLSGLFYALYSIFSRLAVDRGYHALTITFYTFLILTAVLVPFADWKVMGAVVTADPVRNNLIILAHALCLSVLPYMFFNIALNYLETGIVSVLASVEPVAAMVFGILLYGEIPSFLCLAGLVVVLAALAVLSLSGPEAEGSPATAEDETAQDA